MRTAHIVLGSLLAVTALPGPRAQSDVGEAKLSLSPGRDALVLDSRNPGSVFAIVAGLDRARIELPGGLLLTVSPDLLLFTGVLEDTGSARVPVDLVSAVFAGDEVHFQAAIWSFLPEVILPDQLTNRVTAVFRAPSADLPMDDPQEPELEVLDLSRDHDPIVQVLSTDSIPPVYGIVVSAKVRAAKAEMVVFPIAGDADLDPRTVVLGAHLAVEPGSGSDHEEARIVSAGRELGTGIRTIRVRFTSSIGGADSDTRR